LLTKADAVGPSRISNSSFVKDMRGIKSVRIGKSNMMRTGNPIAAEKENKMCLFLLLLVDGSAE
jgi:hypothetical protein